MKLIAGLGNPGRRYAQTRHNVGFMVVDALARRWNCPGAYHARFEAIIGQAQRGPHAVLLMQPQTYMNLSGRSVQAVRQFYKIEPADILVIYDDLDLPPGQLRIRARGSAGGQKGMADVLLRLGTTEIARLRVGIGRVHSAAATAWVLSRFDPREQEVFAAAIETAADAAECWLSQGVAAAMNKYNQPPQARRDQPAGGKRRESPDKQKDESQGDAP